MKIIIDAGHGGSDPGAVAFGAMEKDLNLTLAALLASKLQDMGYDTDRSLINDINYDSFTLTDLINTSGADLCISCHNNSFRGTARGMEVIHSIHSDGRLARLILDKVTATGYIIRSTYSRESTVNPGTDYYFIIRQTYPLVETIIVEFGYMDNADDYALLTSPEWQNTLAAAAAEGVRQYAPLEPPQKNSIMGEAILAPVQLKNALSVNSPSADPTLVDLYYKIAGIYGIKADLAFLQAMFETNWLKFTGVVRPEQNNFAGLGATSSENPGESFPTPAVGVEAHMQHLYAYATAAQLPAGRPLYDTRFGYVQRGAAPNWEDLNGRWAVPGTVYGQTIVAMQKNVAEKYPPEDESDNPPPVQEPHWAKPCNDELLAAGLLLNDHTDTLDQPASEGIVLCLVNRLRKLALSIPEPEPSVEPSAPPVHWAKQCNDELLAAGILYNDHTETLDQPASEAMAICLTNRLRKEIIHNE